MFFLRREPCDGGLKRAGFSSTMGFCGLLPPPLLLLLLVEAYRTRTPGVLLLRTAMPRQRGLCSGSRKRGITALEDAIVAARYPLPRRYAAEGLVVVLLPVEKAYSF